jgi:UDPglucose--hexose-1-phosphate uridylyltransferase
MPEFRQNLATKEWVIISPGRGARPSDFAEPDRRHDTPPSYDKDCPFCPGNEAQTPEPVYLSPEEGNWRVRVVPNKFAALQPDLATTRSKVGSFLVAKGFGIAEVVIEIPDHNRGIAHMQMPEVVEVLKAYRFRYSAIAKNDNINLVTIFRNHGPRAGTSLFHPHSQIIATPIVPPHVRYPIEQAIQHFDRFGSCVYCEIIEQEKKQKERMVVETDSFIAICPFAARTPFETAIFPKRHMASYSLISDEEVDELAWVLKTVMLKLHNCLVNPDYNYVVRSAPIGDEDARYLHWQIEIIPKISTRAGFEMGTGIYINSVAPEDSARYLREVATDS